MDGNESSCFLSKVKHILLEYLILLFPLIQNKSFVLKCSNLSTIRAYCYYCFRKHVWLCIFLLNNFIGKLAVTHLIFKNIWCMVLRYHILHYFFSIIILITQTYKTKIITITRYYFIFPVPGKKENNKPKQFEIEVKLTSKMKKHNLCSNCQIFFLWATLINRHLLIFMRYWLFRI